MNGKITIEQPAHSDPELNAFIRDQLRQFNLQYAPADEHRTLELYAFDDQGVLAGGLLGNSAWGWLDIKILWVRADRRGQGIGERLMAEAEAEGRRRGCHHAYVDTMSFQAPGFYEKLGYTTWGELKDFPTGNRRIFYQKALDQ